MLHAKLALGIRDKSIALRHASRLADLGFQIERVSERGVSFHGPSDLFEQVFHSPVVIRGADARFANEPAIPDEIAEQVDSVYFPTRPTFFPEE
jgi:hypothetical protein